MVLKWKILLTLFLVTSYTTESKAQIVGGSFASSSAYPWMVDLTIGCGASLIKPSWVITAAHCVDAITGLNVGDSIIINSYIKSNPQITSEKRAIKTIIGYPGFSLFLGYYSPDVALIELTTPSTLTPIDIITNSIDTLLVEDNDSCITLGWGSTDTLTTQSDTLKEGRVIFVPRTICQSAYSVNQLWKKDSTHCVGFLAGSPITGAGSGDSGGPLFVMKSGNPLLVGVVSGGGGTTTTAIEPGIFTNLYRVKDWINFVTSGSVSINEVTKNHIKVYFSNDKIIIDSKMKLETPLVWLNIYDLSGKKLESRKLRLDLGINTYSMKSIFPNGVYIVSLNNKNINVNFKLVKAY